MVAVGDVIVDTCQYLIIALVGREVLVRACIVAVFLAYEVRNALHIGLRSARDEIVGISNAVCGGTPAIDHGRRLHHLTVDEEEELVLDDGAAEGETIRGGAVLVAGCSYLFVVYGRAAHVLVAVVYVGRTLERVGTRFGDGVHAAADEVGLAHVIR